MDFFLKQGAGLGVVRRCNEREADQRVVVLTNHPTQATRIACKDAGADRLFDKATEFEDFFDYCLSCHRGPSDAVPML